MGKTRDLGFLRNIFVMNDTSVTNYVPTARSLTINGTTLDLSADRTFNIATSATLGGLTDATISTLVDNQLLRYNAATSKWVNWTPNYLTGITSSQVTTALGFTPYNSTNPSGYITGITSSMVTTALGYTPYNSTNPSGYITGITSSMVTTALGYTPYNSSNPNGYITNNPSYLGLSNTSSTSGYGISLYGGGGNGEMSYGLFFGGTGTFGAHGSVAGSDWATYFTMNNVTTRGWIFRRAGAANVASISSGGNAQFDGSMIAGGDVKGPDVYTTGGWFRNHTNNNGIYWSGTAWHLYPENSSDFYMRSGASDASIHFLKSGGAGSNYIHCASDNSIGFLSTGRSWILRVDNGGSGTFYGNLTANGLIRVNGNTNLYLDYNYGCSIVGVYASTRYQGVFSMGDAYKLAIDGTSPGNLYGLAWSHPNAGGQAGYLNTHGLLIMENGTCNAAIANAIWARGDVTAYSDARVKSNIQVVENAVAKVKAIRGVTFNRTDMDDTNRRYAGVIAQEVLQVLPEVVSENLSNGHYSVSYGNLAALFIEAIKEQQKEIENLKETINGLTK